MIANTAASTPLKGKEASLIRAGDWLRALAGRQRLVVALSGGLVSALAFAPFDFFPLLLVAYAVLIFLLDGAFNEKHPVRAAALVGWCFGFGQFLAGLYWVGYAFTVDAAAHAWQIPFVAVLLPGGLALFPAFACVVSMLWWRRGNSRIFLFATVYALFEWLRGHLLTGFPWNLAAYAWGAVPAIMQSAAVIGAYGLTLLTLLLGASLALSADRRTRRWRLPVSLISVFVLLWIGGEARLALVRPGSAPGVRLRLVQPDIPQAEKYPLKYRLRNWTRLVELSEARTGATPTITIWPEAAPPFLLTAAPEALESVASLMQGNRVLMTGTIRAEPKAGGRYTYFNSFFIFSHGGHLTGIYDKSHLVPFGEYLPLPGLLHALGLNKLVAMPDGLGVGSGPRTFDIPDAPKADPLICYEIIFPGAVVGSVRPGYHRKCYR